MKTILYIAAILTVGMSSGIAQGMFARPQYIPTDRLIENAKAYIAQEPNDSSGYYTLGRIHYLAFVNKSFAVGSFGGDSSSVIPFWWWGDSLWHEIREEAKRLALLEYGYESTSDVPASESGAFWDRVRAIQAELESEGWRPKSPTNDQLIEHAGAAQWNFYKAIALDPNNALYYLGQASLGEQYLNHFEQVGPPAMPQALKDIFLGVVKETYFLAYNLSIQEDLKLEYVPLPGIRSIISYEAGNAFIRLWQLEDQIPPDVKEKIAAIKKSLAILDALPPGPITPIIFTMEESSSLEQLLAPKKIVQFDLDGDGHIERRPWVKSTTGFLAWDADRNGRI